MRKINALKRCFFVVTLLLTTQFYGKAQLPVGTYFLLLQNNNTFKATYLLNSKLNTNFILSLVEEIYKSEKNYINNENYSSPFFKFITPRP
jgi:hypothetical protein